MPAAAADAALPLARLRVAPFWPRAAPPATPAARRAARHMRDWLRAHAFLPRPPGAAPSPAALAVFALLRAAPHPHLRVAVAPAFPHLVVTLAVVLPPAAPALLHPASDPLRLLLWHALRPAAPRPSACGFFCPAACAASPARNAFHLSRVFKSSPPPPRPRVPPPPNCPLLALPDDVLLRIVLHLHPAHYAALSDAHPYLHAFLLPVVPGLNLRLYPHQLHALYRMAIMERPRHHPMPLLAPIPVPPDRPVRLFADLVDGALILLHHRPSVRLPLGGLFCDEPGLGKTITALSLVLKTAGRRPKPPPSLSTRLVYAPNGRPVEAYTDHHHGRYQIYGQSTAAYPSRRARLLPGLVSTTARTSTRRVRAPDFYQRSKGIGALPSVANNQHVYLSGATLIIVPPVLVSHWLTQIERHVNNAFVKVLYIRSRLDLPDTALELATYDIVLVSFELLTELYADLRFGAPLLLRVHFLRVIVDEGHKLSSSQVTNFASVCDRIRADLRWVMTGTPTPATPRSDVDYLHSLLTFIRDEAYGLDKDAWRVGIRDPYSAYKSESLERLSYLLSRIMIRADKSILKAQCHVKNVVVDFSRDTASSYNGLVRMTRRNLITSDWYSREHKESLLNPRNHALARFVMGNLRKACCFGGTMDVAYADEDIIDTLDILFDDFKDVARLGKNDRFRDPIVEMSLLDVTRLEDEADREEQEDIRRRAELYHRLVQEGRRPLRLSKILPKEMQTPGRRTQRMIYTGKLQILGEAFRNRSCFCARCNRHTTFPLVTTCGHLLCDECLVLDRRRCVATGCGIPYVLDGKGVPEKLIELQPSMWSENWRDDWAETKSSKMDYLIQRIESLPPNEEWLDNELEPKMVPPKVIVHSEYGDHLKLVALLMKRSEKLRNAYVEMVVNLRDIHEDAKKHKTASELAIQSVKRFTEDPKIQVLLMNTRHGAVGLDLSFVQYIFLLEPLWDAANELQIISRAHRIGCKQDIFVERLVMRDSVEQDMLADLQTSVNRLAEPSLPGLAQAKAERDHLKLSSLLRNLKVVHSKDDIAEREAMHDISENEENVEEEVLASGNGNYDSGAGSSSSCAGLDDEVGRKRGRRDDESSDRPRRVRFKCL